MTQWQSDAWEFPGRPEWFCRSSAAPSSAAARADHRRTPSSLQPCPSSEALQLLVPSCVSITFHSQTTHSNLQPDCWCKEVLYHPSCTQKVFQPSGILARSRRSFRWRLYLPEFLGEGSCQAGEESFGPGAVHRLQTEEGYSLQPQYLNQACPFVKPPSSGPAKAPSGIPPCCC